MQGPVYGNVDRGHHFKAESKPSQEPKTIM